MAPITRVAAALLLFSTIFVQGVPVLAPAGPSDPAPALAQDVQAFAADSHALTKRAGVNIVTRCSVPNTIAITFDDGPAKFTDGLLTTLKKENVKATFFVNAQNNGGKISDYTAVIKRAYADGHQIASHTFSHQDLAKLNEKQIAKEMNDLDTEVKKILGVRPIYMRPPYGSTNTRAENWLNKNGYKIINWNLDTNDWKHPKDWKKSIKAYTDAFKKDPKKEGYIALQHDPNAVTSGKLAQEAIKLAKKYKLNIVTVGECLGQTNSASWYRK
ncbi:hypothetical protein BGW38_002831 [Lunasporangiospora selenospora]|uniref:NodB homology domain-containing protein n=1 Tax=Lunasporangiospora selenospora TaxID=979761 RepID=A0A9P6FTI9_9FUNG|nr:hypothetical protein BGW38_002831 [Lunasporangiospora selenospora]